MISSSKFIATVARCVSLCAIVLSGGAAHSQAIEIKAQAYRVDTPLPFGTPAAASPAPTPTTPAPVALPAKTWEISPADGTLSRALLRWATEANVNLVYEANADMPAVSVTYTGDFWSALGELLKDTSSGSYPLHGCQYTNTTRILHVTQACDR